MAILYEFTERQDSFFIKNLDAITLTYKLFRIANCPSITYEIFTSALELNEEDCLNIYEDASYKLTISNGVDTDIDILFSSYKNLEKSIANNTFILICDKCNNCNDECDSYCQLLNTLAKAEVKRNLSDSLFNIYYNLIYTELVCLLEKNVNYRVKEEMIYGKNCCDLRTPQILLSAYYLTMYYYEFFKATTIEESTYICNKYKMEDVFCCIRNLGINIDNIQSIIQTYNNENN